MGKNPNFGNKSSLNNAERLNAEKGHNAERTSRNLILLIPEAVVLSVYIDWILEELSKVLTYLLEGKQTEKFDRMRSYQRVLFGGGFMLVIISTLDWFMLEQSDPHAVWSYLWYLDEGIPCLYFLLIIVTTMYLWRPHDNFVQYATSQQLGYSNYHQEERGTNG